MKLYNSFFDVKLRFIHTLLSFLSRSPDIGLLYTIESTSFLKRKLEKYFGPLVKVEFVRGIQKDGSLPFIPALSIRASFPEGAILSASAIDANEELLFIKTSGEFLERLSTHLPLDTWKKHQFERNTTLRELKGEMVKVKSVLDGKSITYPLEDLYWGFPVRNNLIRNSTTNGSAGHFNPTKAIINAWTELIQRDAFMVHWLLRFSPPRLVLSTLSGEEGKEIERILRLCKRYRLEVVFLDITTDIRVPTCCCVVTSYTSPDKTLRKVSVGAASGFHAERALLSALTEAVNVHVAFYDAEPFVFKEEADQKIGRKERLSQSFTEETFKQVAFLTQGKEERSLEEWMHTSISSIRKEPSSSEIVRYLTGLFKKRAKANPTYEVFSVPIQNSLLDTFGYTVVRLMCDALYPLHLKEELIPRDHPRLKEFALYARIADVQIHTWPHIFP